MSFILKTLHLPTYRYELCSVLPCVSVSVWNNYWHVFVYFSSSSRVTKLGVRRAVEQPGCRRCRHQTPPGHDLHITQPVISILSLTWHNYVFNTHTLIVTTQNISSNIVRGPVLVLAKKIACSEIPDFNCIKSLLFMNHESFIWKLWSFARNTVFLGHPVSNIDILRYYPKSSRKYKAVSPQTVSSVTGVWWREASSAQWAATRDHWRGVVTYNKRSRSGGTQYYKC